MTESPEKTSPLLPLASNELETMLTCDRCGLKYQVGKSTSSLRLTYCSFLCELGDLGFSMAGLEAMERKAVDETATSDGKSTDGNEPEAPALAGAEQG